MRRLYVRHRPQPPRCVGRCFARWLRRQRANRVHFRRVLAATAQRHCALRAAERPSYLAAGSLLGCPSLPGAHGLPVTWNLSETWDYRAHPAVSRGGLRAALAVATAAERRMLPRPHPPLAITPHD